MRVVLALGVVAVLLATGCGGPEDDTQRFARAAVESYVAGNAAYEGDEVRCTGNARPWFVERQATVVICAVRRAEGGVRLVPRRSRPARFARDDADPARRAERRLRAARLTPEGLRRGCGSIGTVPSGGRGYPRTVPISTGQRLLRFDRRLEARFVAGADEAGRGSLAGPLVVAGVLLDYGTLRGHRVRPLASLNDSKQVEPEERERLFDAVLQAATRVVVRVISSSEIDDRGLHRSNLLGLRTVLADLRPPAEVCLVDGFRLGPLAPRIPQSWTAHEERGHRRRIDRREGHARPPDAASLRRVSPLGFSSHVGYITPAHTRAVLAHGPCPQHRRSFNARAYDETLVA